MRRRIRRSSSSLHPQRPRGLPGMCLDERRIGAGRIIVRFPRDWLSDWRTVAADIDRLIATLRPH